MSASAPAPVRSISHDAINQLQIIVSAFELGESKMALDACRRVHELADKLRLEIMGIKPQPQ